MSLALERLESLHRQLQEIVEWQIYDALNAKSAECIDRMWIDIQDACHHQRMMENPQPMTLQESKVAMDRINGVQS